MIPMMKIYECLLYNVFFLLLLWNIFIVPYLTSYCRCVLWCCRWFDNHHCGVSFSFRLLNEMK